MDIDLGARSIGTQKTKSVVVPENASPTSQYTIEDSVEFLTTTQEVRITVVAGTGSFVVGERVTDSSTGTTARVKSFSNGILLVDTADGVFRVGDLVVGQTSGCSRAVAATQGIITQIPI
jgi:apolipoprotein N-acyltransferase